MDNHYYAVIMAGGGGTRLWPLSRQSRPKQMLPLIGNQTLFQDAVQRLDGLFPLERIFIVTTAKMAEEFQKQCPNLPKSNFILEPLPRGTASVAGLAAITLQHLDPQAVIAVLTSDHFIGNISRFHQLLESALEVARQGYLVTLGITPTYPATGYGYIQLDEILDTTSQLTAYKVNQYKEKPNLETARNMLKSGNFAWNSGMFVWSVNSILGEFKHQMPGLYQLLQTISAAWDTPQRQKILENTWQEIKIETIDYGIMEGAKQVAVIPAAGLDWNDVGSWESLFEILPADDDGNITLVDQTRQILSIDTHASLIQSQDSRRLIVTIGIEDLVVVDTGDVLLVCKKDQAQKVRQAVQQLKSSHPELI